ncbi:MAG: M20/M25/M40 family metallo-hydrolase, partial [Anaerolineae bacterium]|nr:M20/M25/M40 family metallo-hydrolase [Anaerolineae bacterium]
PEVEAEFEARLEPLRRHAPAAIRLNLVKGKDGFRVREDEPLVRALQEGYRRVTGRALPLGAASFVGDASNFVHEGGVPAVYFGCGLERAHATPEYVPLSRLEQLARVLVAAAAHYLAAE